MVSVLKTARVVCVLAALAIAPIALGAQSAERGTRAGDIALETLPAQPLERGRCGLFLWAREAQPAFILVAYDDPAQARIRTDGRTREFPRTRFAGEPAYGHFERQTFSDGDMTLDLSLHFDPSRPMRDGAIVSDGVLRIARGDGWQTVLPVGGMVACQR